jgi:glycosyltransferase involved in cell wall biosynthesis
MTNKETKDKIKILFLIDFLASRYGMVGGTERQLIEKIARLDKHEFTPYLIYLQKRYHSELMSEISCYNDVLHIYSLKSLGNITKYIRLWKFIREQNIDIIETVFFDSIMVGVITAKLAGVKHIISCRRDMGFWYSKPLLKILVFLNYFTDRIIVNSQAIKLHIANHEKISSAKIDVIHNGIDVDKFATINRTNLHAEFPSINFDDKIVGFVGNFNRQVKRVDLFIRALANVIKEDQRVKFVILGDGKLKPQLLQLSQKLGVENYLIWTGRKDNPVPYIKAFDIGVVSSDSEGFCNAILEYMAAGLPVVATDTGGNPELIEDGGSGFLVPVNDHHALAEKISFLLANKDTAFAMGQRGKKIVEEKYSWDKIIKEYEAYYENLASQ